MCGLRADDIRLVCPLRGVWGKILNVLYSFMLSVGDMVGDKFIQGVRGVCAAAYRSTTVTAARDMRVVGPRSHLGFWEL